MAVERDLPMLTFQDAGALNTHQDELRRLLAGDDRTDRRFVPGVPANRYWFKKGQEDAREPAFFVGLLVGWASAAAVWGGLVWWLG